MSTYVESAHGDHANARSVVSREGVCWGAILAGTAVALTMLALMATIGAAIGMSSYDRGEDDLRNFALGGGFWGLLSTVVAFAAGGCIAARASGVFGRGNGLLNGALVAAVAIPLLLYIAGSAAATMAAAEVGNGRNVSDRTRVGSTETIATSTAGNSAVADGVRDGDRAQSDASKTAWMTIVGMVLAIGAAGAGGYLARREVDTDDRTTPETGRGRVATHANI